MHPEDHESAKLACTGAEPSSCKYTACSMAIYKRPLFRVVWPLGRVGALCPHLVGGELVPTW